MSDLESYLIILKTRNNDCTETIHITQDNSIVTCDRLWPGYASAHNNLGTLMSSLHEAEDHFTSAIRISPSHVNAHYNLGQVFR